MILRKSETRTFDLPACHGGPGVLRCTEYLGDYDKTSAGFKFIHDNVLPPGAGVGPHEHSGDEELYIFLEGHGIMTVNGIPTGVEAGDICITRNGNSHSLLNTGEADIRFLVVGTNIGHQAS
jgi:uncharacterized cupin superfamily protein